MRTSSPYQFDEFFASGLSETVSPFLTPSSRKWSQNIPLKSAFLSSFLLLIAFIFSFYSLAVSHLFLSAVFFLVGVPALLDALKDFKNLEINIDVLMTLSAFLSLFIGSGLEGALLLVLFELSGAMEDTVTGKARGAIHHLKVLSPTLALVLDHEGNYYEKSVKEIETGTHVLVKAGEIVPLDGKIILGTSSVNLVHLTGESLPVLKHPGMDVPAGARNLESSLTIEITKTSSNSTLSRIIDLIIQASEAKPKIQRVLDKFGKKYAWTIILLTFAFALFLPFLFAVPFLGMEGSLYRALAFMIAASPCALIIGAPTAYLSAISSCAKKGILLKGGIALDALAACHKICFDKTGTLTTGELKCLDFGLLTEESSIPSEFALGVAGSLEKNVVHPIAEAILRKAKEMQAPKIELASYEALPGYGLKGTVSYNGKLLNAFLGLPEFTLSEFSQEKKTLFLQKLKEMTSPGEIVSLLVIDHHLFYFRFSDEIRPNAAQMLSDIQNAGLKTLLMTGDNAANAHSVASKIGITEVYADLRPEDKLSLISKFSQDAGLAMVGDGINDAPSLARASVGISLGKVGSSTAHDASDIILLNDDVSLISFLVSKAKKTLKIVKQNLTLALAVILLATTPALLGLVPLWLAVILHEGGTVLVGLNSLRLLKN
jgi:Zn2+/Cd2+-exporting ATPase